MSLMCDCCGQFPCGIDTAIRAMSKERKDKLNKKVMEKIMGDTVIGHAGKISDDTDFELPTKAQLSEGVTVIEDKNKPVLGSNPKDLMGVKKVPIHLVPESSIIYQALAMQDGAAKYGPYNWRENKVLASIYVSAAKRHLAAWFDSGEELASDSKKPHLGHAMACLGIIIDAYETGNLIDDRPLPGAAAKLISDWENK